MKNEKENAAQKCFLGEQKMKQKTEIWEENGNQSSEFTTDPWNHPSKFSQISQISYFRHKLYLYRVYQI